MFFFSDMLFNFVLCLVSYMMLHDVCLLFSYMLFYIFSCFLFVLYAGDYFLFFLCFFSHRLVLYHLPTSYHTWQMLLVIFVDCFILLYAVVFFFWFLIFLYDVWRVLHFYFSYHIEWYCNTSISPIRTIHHHQR